MLRESHTWKFGWVAASIYALYSYPLVGVMFLAVGGYLTWRSK